MVALRHKSASSRQQLFRYSMLLLFTLLAVFDLPAHTPPFQPLRKCEISSQWQRPHLPFRAFSPSGHFALHYDTAGVDGVHVVDRDSNGIPDFIDTAALAFDAAWRLLIDTLGFPAPPLDSGMFYPVYVQDLSPSGLYGITTPEEYLGSNGSADRYTTFILIDNSYSRQDSAGDLPAYTLFGEAALRTTAVHEFFHAIQIGWYGMYLDAALFHELSSSWAEIRAYPNIPSFLPFITVLLRHPEHLPFSDASNAFAGYAYALFARYCTENANDTIIRWMWELASSMPNFYLALDSALRRTAHSLPALWCRFAQGLLFAGRSSPGDSVFIPYQELLPSPVPYREEVVDKGVHYVSGSLHPLEFRFLRFLLPSPWLMDTLNVLVASMDLRAVSQSGTTVEYSLTVDPSGSLQVTFAPSDTVGCWKSQKTLPNAYRTASAPYPQPFHPAHHSTLRFPIPQVSGAPEAVHLDIFSTAPEYIGTVSLPLSYRDGYWGADWNGTLQGIPLPEGLYLFRIRIGTKELWGKFSILY